MTSTKAYTINKMPEMPKLCGGGGGGCNGGCGGGGGGGGGGGCAGCGGGGCAGCGGGGCAGCGGGGCAGGKSRLESMLRVVGCRWRQNDCSVKIIFNYKHEK